MTVTLGGGGSGTLSSNSSALFATTVVGPNDVATNEHRPGLSAQSTSPPSRCSTRRTTTALVKVPVALVGAKSELCVQSAYDVASLVHSTICAPALGVNPEPDIVTVWKLRRPVSGVTVVCTAGNGPLGSKSSKTCASKS